MAIIWSNHHQAITSLIQYNPKENLQRKLTMISINPKLLIVITFSLSISIPIIVNANTGESRATKIISLTKESENKESSIQEQSKLFIKDLREKYPHFSDDQLKSMQRAYEDTILESATAPQIKTEKKKVQKGLKLDEPPTKTKLQGRLEQFVNTNINKNKTGKKTSESSNSKEIKKEAKNTVISLTVRKGDTLSDIAKREYGDPNMYIAIYEENKDKLRSPSSVPEGITLRVPKIDSSMKNKFGKMKKDYENKVAKERRIKQKKIQEQRKKQKEKEREKREKREQQRKEKQDRDKEQEEKQSAKEKENEEKTKKTEKKQTSNTNLEEKEDNKTYKSMEELQRMILEGKY